MQTVTKVLTEIELKRGEGKGEEEGTRRKVDGIGWKKREGTWKLLHIDGGKCAETFWDTCREKGQAADQQGLTTLSCLSFLTDSVQIEKEPSSVCPWTLTERKGNKKIDRRERERGRDTICNPCSMNSLNPITWRKTGSEERQTLI